MGKLGYKGRLTPFVNSVVIEAMLGSYLYCVTLEDVRGEGFRITVGELEVKAEDDWHWLCRNEASIAAGQLSAHLQQPAASPPLHELNPLGCCAKDNPCWGGSLCHSFCFLLGLLHCPTPAGDTTAQWPLCWVSAQPRVISDDTGRGHMTHAS